MTSHRDGHGKPAFTDFQWCILRRERSMEDGKHIIMVVCIGQHIGRLYLLEIRFLARRAPHSLSL